jgi:hypothetical protein
VPPPFTAATTWTIDLPNHMFSFQGVLKHPFLQVIEDTTGAYSGVFGYISAGQRVYESSATVDVVPGTPGYLNISRDLDSLSINDGNYITDSVAMSETAGIDPTTRTADRLGPSSETYLTRLTRHACVDFALPDQPTALRAADLVDSVAVNTHLSYGGFKDTPTRTGTYAALENALLDLGITHIRETYSGDLGAGVELMRMGTRGIKTDLVFNAVQAQNPGSAPTAAQAVDYIASLGTAIDSVEGENEPAVVAPAQQFQRELYAAMKADPRTANIPLGTPAINPANLATYDQIGDLSAYADWGSLHAYPMTEPYSRRLYLDDMLEQMRKVANNLPTWVTEAGWDSFTSGAYRGLVDAPEVDYCGYCASERATAAYVPKMLLTNLAAGVKRSYIYELIDEGALSPPAAEDYFGLIRADLTPKPVYQRLKTLNRLMADPGTLAVPGTLAHTVSPSTVQHVLLQKSDGSFWLALWKDDRLWANEPAGSADTRAIPHDLYPEPTTATLSFGQAVTGTEYQLAAGTSHVRTWPTASSFSVSVPADDVVLLKLDPVTTLRLAAPDPVVPEVPYSVMLPATAMLLLGGWLALRRRADASS